MASEINFEQLTPLLGLSSEWMAVLTPDGFVSEANPALLQSLGFDQAELKSLPFFDLLHVEDLSKAQLEIQKLYQGAGKVSFEARCRRKSQDYLWVRWACLLSAAEKRFYLAGRDITELKETLKALEENRAKFKRLNESATEGVAIHDKGVILEANQALARLLGFEKTEDILGLNGMDFVAPEYRQLVLSNILSGLEEPYEAVGVRKDGSRFNCLLSGRTVSYQGRTVRVSTFLDITISKRREQELFESQELFRKLAEASQDGIAVSEKGRILVANPALAQMFGVTVPEMIGRNAVEYTAPEFRERLLEKILEGTETPYEVMGLRKDGSRFPVQIFPRMTTYQGRRVRVAFFHDITLRKKIEEEVLRQKEFSHNLLNSSLDGLMAFDSQCRYTLWNPAMERLTGHSREEVLGHCAFDVFPFLRQIGQDQFFYEALRGKTVVAHDRQYRTPAGKQGWFEAVYSPIKNPKGEIIGGLGVIHDTTDRKRMEEALRQSELSLKAVFNNTFQNIVLLDAGGCIKTFNANAAAALRHMTGRELEVGKPLGDILSDPMRLDFRQRFEKALKGEAVQFEQRYGQGNGGEQWMEVSYNPVFGDQGDIEGVCLVSTNIDERKRVEEALQKSEADLRALFNSSHQHILLAGKNGRIRDFNQSAGEIIQRLRGETLEVGRLLGDYVEPEHKQGFQERFKKVLKGEVIRLERTVKSLEGKEYWFEFTYSPVFDGQGRVLGVCLTVESIGERRIAAEALKKSETMLRGLFNSVNQNILLMDTQGVIQSFNPSTQATYLKAIGKSIRPGDLFLDYVRPEDRETARDRIQKALRGEVVRVERPYSFEDGTPHWLEYAYHPVLDEGGKIIGICFTSQSIDGRKQSEEALRESEERFRKIFEDAPIGMTVADKNFRYMRLNRSFCAMLGYAEEELIGRGYEELTHPDDVAGTTAHKPEVFNGKGFRMRKRYLHKNGDPVWVDLTVHSFLDEKGALLYGLGMVENVTERKRWEEALKESEEKFRKIFEDAPLGMAMAADFHFIKVNRAFLEMLGYREEEVIGKSFRDLTHPDDLGESAKIADAVHHGERDRFTVEKRYLKKSGEGLWVQLSGTVIKDPEGKNLYSILLVEDITERKGIHEALRENQERFERMAQVSREGILLHENPTIVDVNPALAAMLGYRPEEMIGKSGFDFLAPESLETARRHMLAGSSEPYEALAVRKNGDLFPVELRGGNFHLRGRDLRVLSVRDLTESKKINEKLLRYERLAAVGKVIAGIAHEVRNPLSVVSGMSQLLKTKLESRSVFSQELETILSHANRLKYFMNDILDYSRDMEIKKGPLQPKTLLDQSLVLAQAQLPAPNLNTLIVWGLDPTLPELLADGGRLEQVLVNLILNAYQALDGGGTITLSATARDGWMILGVQDDGPGIPEADRGRLFEPFFTTKKHGSGLGLSISQKIAEAHGGRIEVERVLPHGTLFTLHLPLSGNE